MNCIEGDVQYSIPKLAFKAVENFFRRISFNLGNTPSETDIKIVSCIPVDVSDLQAKILCLEKELETHKKKGVKFKNSAVHTTLINQNFYTDSMETQTKADDANLDEHLYLRSGANPKKAHTPTNDNKNNLNRITSLAFDIMGIEDTNNRPRRHKAHNKIRVQRDHQVYNSQVQTPRHSYGNDWNSLIENDMIRKSDTQNIKSHSLNMDTFSNISRNDLTFNRDSTCDSVICLRPNENLACFENDKHRFDDNTVILSPKRSKKDINNNATTSKFYNDRYYDLIPVKIDGNQKSKARNKGSPIEHLMEELAMNKTNYKFIDKATGCDEDCPSTNNHRDHAIKEIFKTITNTDDDTSKHSKSCSTPKRNTSLQAQNLMITEESASNFSNHLKDDAIQVKEMKTKTDDTLSEIKTILKSVVNLVKRRSSRTMTSRKRSPRLVKRDATVQKDLNDVSIERPRYCQPLESNVNYSYYPGYPCRPLEQCIQPCFIPSQASPFYSFSPVSHYYQNDHRQVHCYPYHY